MKNPLQVMLSTQEPSLNSPNRILNSWKEISAYLRRGIRTVQRYEPELGLPVHRLGGKNCATSVIAFSDEIDLWLRCRTQTPADITFDDKLDQATKALEEAFAVYQVCLRRYVEVRRLYAQNLPFATDVSATPVA